jgi:hypothetical protein
MPFKDDFRVGDIVYRIDTTTYPTTVHIDDVGLVQERHNVHGSILYKIRFKDMKKDWYCAVDIMNAHDYYDGYGR